MRRRATSADRRMLNDITKRLSKALRRMRHMGLVTSSTDAKGTFRCYPKA